MDLLLSEAFVFSDFPRDILLEALSFLYTQEVVTCGRICKKLLHITRQSKAYAVFHVDTSEKFKHLATSRNTTVDLWRSIFSQIRVATADLGGGTTLECLLLILSFLEMSEETLSSLSLHVYLDPQSFVPWYLTHQLATTHKLIFPRLEQVQLRESHPDSDDVAMSLAYFRQWQLPFLRKLQIIRCSHVWCSGLDAAMSRLHCGAWTQYSTQIEELHISIDRGEGFQVDLGLYAATLELLQSAPDLSHLQSLRFSQQVSISLGEISGYFLRILQRKRPQNISPNPLYICFELLKLNPDAITDLDKLITTKRVVVEAHTLDFSKLLGQTISRDIRAPLKRLIRSLSRSLSVLTLFALRQKEDIWDWWNEKDESSSSPSIRNGGGPINRLSFDNLEELRLNVGQECQVLPRFLTQARFPVLRRLSLATRPMTCEALEKSLLLLRNVIEQNNQLEICIH